jgi:hypothetical protein
MNRKCPKKTGTALPCGASPKPRRPTPPKKELARESRGWPPRKKQLAGLEGPARGGSGCATLLRKHSKEITRPGRPRAEDQDENKGLATMVRDVSA